MGLKNYERKPLVEAKSLYMPLLRSWGYLKERLFLIYIALPTELGLS
jgi:hypothetical protein